MTIHIKTATLFAAVVLLGGLTAAQAQPRPCRGGGPWTEGAPYQQAFDPKTVQMIEGTISAVVRTPSRWMSPGVHLRLKTSTEIIDVHLGPAWFVDSEDISLAVGNKVQVRGSRSVVQGKPTLIAMTLTTGNMTLRLRDADGFPYWAGWRYRSGGPRGPARGPYGPR